MKLSKKDEQTQKAIRNALKKKLPVWEIALVTTLAAGAVGCAVWAFSSKSVAIMGIYLPPESQAEELIRDEVGPHIREFLETDEAAPGHFSDGPKADN